MLYKKVEKFNYIETAGKITIAAAVSGVLIFAFVFLFNAGKTELLKVEAQTATTTLTVLNTPPIWIEFAREEFESSTTTPTNSGRQVSFVARADNSGNAPYFLLICSTSATPTPNAAPDLGSLGTRPPACVGGVQWGVSTATAALAPARVATTTTEISPFGETNNWFGWVCDDDPVNPRCNDVSYQGTNATNSSPFHVNFRPTFTSFTNNSPQNPGAVVTFFSTSTDPDLVGGEDLLRLFVCNANDFNATTTSCGVGGTIATTTIPVTANASSSFTLPSVIRDDIYNAFGFIVDNHGHAAVGGSQGTNSGFTVRNVAPTVAGGSISLNGGANISLSVPSGQTLNFPLTFETSDANSCRNAASSSEMVGYVATVYRSSIGTTTCSGLAGSYNPNNCYPSGAPSSVWNLTCTASTTSCTGPTDPTQLWSCTFPLWFIAEPTDVVSPFAADTWLASVAGIDDNNATGTRTVGSSPVELLSFPAINLITGQIPYGSLEPGFNTTTLRATTTIQSVGNTGLNQELAGESMCPGFTTLADCPNSASSTIPENRQQFGTSSIAYGSGLPLSSSTPQLLQLRVPKTTSTSTPNTGITYWGIGVPIQITTAGAYTGLNTFYGVTSSSTHW